MNLTTQSRVKSLSTKNIFEKVNNKLDEAEQIGGSRHCAAIVHKGEILSFGFNKRKTHPLMLKFQVNIPEKQYLHAEIDAIRQIKDKSILTECEIYVSRKSRGNNIGNSEPCPICRNAIRYYGIKKVYWT